MKNKNLSKGDLVLVYTLKQHASKLKKRGLGPYVVYDISSSGAIRLATLDNKPMPYYISGCRVKKYNEKLTTPMLQRIHDAKVRKRNEAKTIQDAI